MNDGRLGPRLPTAPPSPKPECWRCAEDRRKLYRATLTVDGKPLGRALFCADCLVSIADLDPDPRRVPDAA